MRFTSRPRGRRIADCDIRYEGGVAVACEVGGAFTERECWGLVEAYEQTKTPFMPMENCCYGRMELMLCEMKKAGVFGEIVHCDGKYGHDLREENHFWQGSTAITD